MRSGCIKKNYAKKYFKVTEVWQILLERDNEKVPTSDHNAHAEWLEKTRRMQKVFYSPNRLCPTEKSRDYGIQAKKAQKIWPNLL